MARPFGQNDNSEGQQKRNGEKNVQSTTNLSPRCKEKRVENSSDCCARNNISDQEGQQEVDGKRNVQSSTNLSPRCKEKRTENSSEYCVRNQTSDQSAATVTNVYCISNSNLLNCGPTFLNVINNGEYKTCDSLSSSNKDKCETDRRIKVKKGIFISNRTITVEDIQIVAEVVKEDWKKLLKKLPGVTLNNLRFHQAFIDAMDRKDSTNMAEIALCTWKKELPEYSTIGNLSKALFSIGHPDIVTCLKP